MPPLIFPYDWIKNLDFAWELCRRAAWWSAHRSMGGSYLSAIFEIGVAIVAIILLSRLLWRIYRRKGLLAVWRAAKLDILLPSIVILFWIALFLYNLVLVIPGEIRSQAQSSYPLMASSQKRLPLAPVPPPSAYEFPGPPMIGVALQPLFGIELNLHGGPYDFTHRREYSLKILNTGQSSARMVDIGVQLPIYVEASSIAHQRGVVGLNFEPSTRLVFPAGSGIKVNGCEVATSYKLHATEMKPRSSLEILIVTNDNLKPINFQNFIAGHFTYTFQGKSIKGYTHYIPLNLRSDGIIEELDPIYPPDKVTWRFDVGMIPSPCITNDSFVVH